MVRLGNTFCSPCGIDLPLVLRVHVLDGNLLPVQEFGVRASCGTVRGVKPCNRTICSTEGGSSRLNWKWWNGSVQSHFEAGAWPPIHLLWVGESVIGVVGVVERDEMTST
jgi:hypothetical protein